MDNYRNRACGDCRIAMAIINLLVSIVCLKLWGLIGVFVGTLVSYLLVGIWVDPYCVFKYAFELPPKQYFVKLITSVAVIMVVGLATYGVVQLIPFYLGKLLVSVVLSNGLLWAVYGRTAPFRFVKLRAKSLFGKKRQ